MMGPSSSKFGAVYLLGELHPMRLLSGKVFPWSLIPRGAHDGRASTICGLHGNSSPPISRPLIVAFARALTTVIINLLTL